VVPRASPAVATPVADSVAVASWWMMVKDGEGAAHEAEGHVTVARPRSTTPSARHQVESRWNMLS
jgi:hypothetical protein